MNKKRRDALVKATEYLDAAADIVSDVGREEQYSLDNLPENLQSGDRYDSMETAVDSLEDAASAIEDAKKEIENAMG